jgi:hypothetical protein
MEPSQNNELPINAVIFNFVMSSLIKVFTLLEASILSFDFDDCTNDVKTVEEGIAWKEEQCKNSRFNFFFFGNNQKLTTVYEHLPN